MGKGLECQKNGTHIAFSAGTGCLVYMDLAAFLLRRELGMLETGERDQLDEKGFKFIFYVSFQSREDSIALEFLEELHQYFKNKDRNQTFELVVRLSNEKTSNQGRWDEIFVDNILSQNKSQIERIWVCGPPIMNRNFDLIL